MKVKKSLLLVDVLKQSHTGEELSKTLVKYGFVKKDFDRKVKNLIAQRRNLLDRLK